MADHKEQIDAVTGTATTGHEWDGLQELNTPLPRWWLYMFYATILWAIGYWIVYPAWPLISNSTQGVLGWHTRTAIVEDLAELKAKRGPMMEKLAGATVQQIAGDPQLSDFARAVGRVAFADNCAPCHGSGGGGGKGYPNLRDDVWIWGGGLSDIQHTIQVGVRSGHAGALGETIMPAFGRDEMLTPAQVADLTEYVVALSRRPADAAAVARVRQTYADQCAACHGPAGKGDPARGVPNLTDAEWLNGSSREAIHEQIFTGRNGVMPAWQARFSPETIKALAVYIHANAGGEPQPAAIPQTEPGAAAAVVK